MNATSVSQSPIKLSQRGARQLQITSLGLSASPTRAAKKSDLLKAIRAMHVLQIDTISVVNRSPYFVLFSRIGTFKQHWLEAHLAEGKLFEHWAHAACFLPIDDYGLYRWNMLNPAAAGFKRTVERLKTQRRAANALLKRVRDSGAVRTIDFERVGGKGNGWWDWKPEKLLLESLFNVGELMIARRDNFHRVYDVRERVHPSWDDAHLPARAEIEKTWTLNAVKAMGIAPAAWIGDYFRHAGKVANPHPDQFVASGELIEARVEGWTSPAYVHPDNASLAKKASREALPATHATLLSPFDPLVWHRDRASAMFSFDYRIECYTPEAKRRYGYFSLPILVDEALIGRADCKAHRAEGVFEVRALYLENAVAKNKASWAALAARIANAITECAAWHETPTVRVTRCEPVAFAKVLQAALI
jgi:uncharacterized protein